MMWVMLVAVVINDAGAEWGLSDFMVSLYAMSQSAGVFLGSYFWGYMSDKYGRMFSFKKTLFLCGVTGCIAAFSYDFPMLCVLAFIVGIGIGGDISVDGTVFIEFCPKADRHMLTLMSFVCVLGSILVPAVAFVYTVATNSDYWTWRYTMVTVSVLNLVFGLLRWKCMETPHFYVTQGKLESANAILRRLSDINKKPLALIPVEEDTTTLMHEYLSDTGNIGVSRQLQRLFKSKVRNTTLWFMMVGTKQIWFFTAFTFSGFGVFMPEFLKKAGGSEHSSNADVYAAMTLQQLVGVVSVLGATLAVRSRLGRKWSQALSLIAGSVFMFIFLVPFAYWAVLLCSTLFYFFSLMAYSVQYAYTPESFPADIRNTGVGLCSASNRLASVISPLIAGGLLETQYGTIAAVVVYSGSLFLAGACGCMTKETKGANIEAEAETLTRESESSQNII